MKLITNISKANNHLSTIVDNLIVSDEAYFAVAFLKKSGLKSLLNPIKDFLIAGGKIFIITGQNFALTEPKALHEIKILFETYQSSKLFLAKANSAENVFHPKLYLFKSKNDCVVISGSANITHGGLVENREASIIIRCKANEKIWIDSKNYFDELLKNENSDEASILVIKQYETYFEQQKQYNIKAKPIPTKTKYQLAFEYNHLVKHFEKFNNLERQQSFKEKMSNYKRAKDILDEIADDHKIEQKLFVPLLDSLVGSKGVKSLWYSGSLFRLRSSVYPFYKEFGELVRYIRDNKNQSADIVFENAKEKIKIIKGAGENYITEIMMTYNNKEFANINKNPLTVLRKEGGVNIKATSSSYSGSDYKEYCSLIKEISEKLGIKNMLEADSFFNEIYWMIKNRKIGTAKKDYIL